MPGADSSLPGLSKEKLFLSSEPPVVRFVSCATDEMKIAPLKRFVNRISMFRKTSGDF
jgi:hypothetical protein